MVLLAESWSLCSLETVQAITNGLHQRLAKTKAVVKSSGMVPKYGRANAYGGQGCQAFVHARGVHRLHDAAHSACIYLLHITCRFRDVASS